MIGSHDNTKKILGQWQTKLIEAGIQHRIILDDNAKPGDDNTTDKIRRIVKLAKIRNLSLEPLLSQTTTDQFDKILYLNDIVFNAKDAIGLLTTRDGDYDAVCVMVNIYIYRYFNKYRILLASNPEKLVANPHVTSFPCPRP